MSIEQLKKKLESESKGNGIKYDEESCIISINGKEIGQWNNEANQDCPEDLIWSRDIGCLYGEAFQAGHEAATNRLLPLLEKAVEVIKIYGEELEWDGVNNPAYIQDRGKIARKFLAEINKEFGESPHVSN